MTTRPFRVTMSYNNMPAIELSKPEEPHEFLRQAVTATHMDDPFYQKKQGAGPFLQGADKDGSWTLVEFWGRDYHDYIEWLNEQYLTSSKETS